MRRSIKDVHGLANPRRRVGGVGVGVGVCAADNRVHQSQEADDILQSGQ